MPGGVLKASEGQIHLMLTAAAKGAVIIPKLSLRITYLRSQNSRVKTQTQQFVSEAHNPICYARLPLKNKTKQKKTPHTNSGG